MNISWVPVISIDIIGSVLTLCISLGCLHYSLKWTRKNKEDIFRNYIFLLTLAIVVFAISRSYGHLVKQLLVMNDLTPYWKKIAPFSGAINSTIFIVIFAFGIYFQRFQKVHVEIQKYKNELEDLVKERTAELVETNITLENVLNSSNPICITSIDHKLIRANQAYYDIWPTVPQKDIPLYCYDSRPGSLCHTEYCPISQINNGKEEVSFEVTKNVDSLELEFIVVAKPLLNADKQLIGIVENFQEITARKKMEVALQAERERLAVTLRSIGDGVITTDLSGKIVLMNKVAEKMTCWSQEEATGQDITTVLQLIYENNQKEDSESIALRVIRSNQIVRPAGKVSLQAKDGTLCNLSVSGSPIISKESDVIGVVVVFRDITQKIKMEEELLKIRKLESVAVLAGGIAHDFNNILAAILGNLNLAQLDRGMDCHSFELLGEAEKATLRAKDLTMQLLTFSKGGEPVKETASLKEVIQESALFVTRGYKAACEFCIPEDLYMVDIDKGQISQVIQNIIINSRTAMPDGGVIQVSCENIKGSEKVHLFPEYLAESDKYVKIVISDSGVGIPDKIIDSIFDPYFSTKSEGSGLGLAICHSIIDKHNGHIEVESQEGKGTTFTIYLPATNEVAGSCEMQKSGESVRESDNANKGRKYKVLIMDDEEMVRQVAAAMVSTLGYNAVLAKDGEEAVQCYRESIEKEDPIDLTLMDLTIPGGMGGKEAVRNILSINNDAKVVVSSGYSNDPIMANAKEYGFCAAVIKPYQLNELKRVFDTILS